MTRHLLPNRHRLRLFGRPVPSGKPVHGTLFDARNDARGCPCGLYYGAHTTLPGSSRCIGANPQKCVVLGARLSVSPPDKALRSAYVRRRRSYNPPISMADLLAAIIGRHPGRRR